MVISLPPHDEASSQLTATNPNMIKPKSARLAVQMLNFPLHLAGFRNLPCSRGSITTSLSRQFSSTCRSSASKGSLQPRCNPTNHSRAIPSEKVEGIARIDENISIEDLHVLRNLISQGRGGTQFKRTLPQFSLENSVSVVTGGASGIGLAVGRATVASGSHLAIVDLNRELFFFVGFLSTKNANTNQPTYR